MTGCAPCTINTERGYCTGCNLPRRIPGRVALPGPATPRLTFDAFVEGWMRLKDFARLPANPAAQATYYDLVKWELYERDWNRAVDETIRTQQNSRLPSPEQMIARSGRQERPTAEDIDPHAGRWVFRCQECGYSALTQARDLTEPPAVCSRCTADASRQTREWWNE